MVWGKVMELNEALSTLEQAGYLVEDTTKEDLARIREEDKRRKVLLRAVKKARTADELIAAIEALKAELGDNLAVEFNYNVYPHLWLSGDEDHGGVEWTLEFTKKDSEPEWK